MYVFIAIIFIAELIIAGFVIYWLRKFDGSVLEFITKTDEGGVVSVDALKEVRRILKSAKDTIGNSVDFIAKTRRQIRNKFIGLVMIYILIFLFNLKFKKAAKYLRYAMFFRDFWLSIPV